MAAVFQNLMQRLFGKPEARALMLGLDAAGKTTVLYRWALGEVVTTIPTIGFNVETVKFAHCNITAWDVGGCDKIRPLWRHYYQNTSLVIYIIDSNDRQRMIGDGDNTAATDLQLLLKEDELRDASVLVLANKQDLPNAMSVRQITETLKLNELLKGRHWTILPCSATRNEGLAEAATWIDAAITNKPKAVMADPESKEAAPKPAQAAAPAPNNPYANLEKWLEIEDEPDDVFLEKFRTYNLDAWDHRTHLRIAWVLLNKEGRRKGLKMIFDGIENYIKNSGKTRNTFHLTLTYFWVQMIHYAMVATKNPDNQFKTFLLMNPQLSNFGLYLEYYSNDLMMKNPTARTEMVLPDKKPLPSIVPNAKLLGASALASS